MYENKVFFMISPQGWHYFQETVKNSQVYAQFYNADVKLMNPENGNQAWYWDRTRWDDEIASDPLYEMRKYIIDEDEEEYLFIRIGENTNDAEQCGILYDDRIKPDFIREIKFNKQCEYDKLDT